MIKSISSIMYDILVASLVVDKCCEMIRGIFFHKQNYKFQYTVRKLHKSFWLLLHPSFLLTSKVLLIFLDKLLVLTSEQATVWLSDHSCCFDN